MTEGVDNSKSYEVRQGVASLKMMAWILIWTISMVVADKAVLYEWYSAQWMLVGGVVLNLVLGIVMVLSYIQFLHSLDDLQRKIQFDALAFALGASLVASFSYSLMTTSGFITDPETLDIILVMMVAYVSAVVVGMVRFR